MLVHIGQLSVQSLVLSRDHLCQKESITYCKPITDEKSDKWGFEPPDLDCIVVHSSLVVNNCKNVGYTMC